MNTLAIFGLQFVMSVGVFALFAKWYLAPWLVEKPTRQALALLILPHAFRHIGLLFLVPGIVAQPLPTFFANTAAYGDLASAFLALFALVALRRNWRFALPAVWTFNVFGSVDLLNALRQADVVPDLGATWVIPTFFVPLLLVTHFMIFTRLLKSECRTK